MKKHRFVATVYFSFLYLALTTKINHITNYLFMHMSSSSFSHHFLFSILFLLSYSNIRLLATTIWHMDNTTSLRYTHNHHFSFIFCPRSHRLMMLMNKKNKIMKSILLFFLIKLTMVKNMKYILLRKFFHRFNFHATPIL